VRALAASFSYKGNFVEILEDKKVFTAPVALPGCYPLREIVNPLLAPPPLDTETGYSDTAPEKQEACNVWPTQ
jgi:hypothetical protein